MVRVLHIFNMMGNGGIEHFVMDRYRCIDRAKIQFDFLMTSSVKGFFDGEIEQLGGKIYYVTPVTSNPIKTFLEIFKIVSEQHYNIVHRHTGNAIGYFDLCAAKFGGAKHLIMHSHNNHAERLGLHYVAKWFLSIDCIRLACSESAGKWLFGKKNYTVVNNAINLEPFFFNEGARNIVRKEYGISDSLVVGNIGRLDYQKNQKFLIDILTELKKTVPNAKLLIVGEGHLKPMLVERATELGLGDDIVFTGQVTNVNEIINAMDVFCLPSNYEGLPLTLIEAQANGLRCFASKDRVTQESNVSGRVVYVPLENNPCEWAKAISMCCGRNDEGLGELVKLYSLKEQIPLIEQFYCSLGE